MARICNRSFKKVMIIPEDKYFADVANTTEVQGATRNSVLRVLRNNNFKVGVEIGVQYGLLSERLLDNGVTDKLYGVDPFGGDVNILKDKDRGNEAYGFTLGKLHKFGDRFTMIKKPSNEALFDIDGQVDFVYLDGGMTKQNVYDDLYYWYAKIRDGGIILGNNYNHSSFSYIKRIVDTYFGKTSNVEDGYLWWMRKEDFDNHKQVSIVTPFYNTSRYAQDLIAFADDSRIAEMIILDDCSEDAHYMGLKRTVNNHPKIKLYRNEENLGEFKTRIKATELAKSDWVIFLDGDNMLTPDYLDRAFSLNWKENVIYAPDYGNHVHIDYRVLDGNYIGKDNAKRYLTKQHIYMFQMFLNTGNYLMNRKKYLEIAKPICEIDKHSYGDIYFNGAWFDAGNLMFVIPGMQYLHRIRKDSVWKEHAGEMQPVINEVISKLR